MNTKGEKSSTTNNRQIVNQSYFPQEKSLILSMHSRVLIAISLVVMVIPALIFYYLLGHALINIPYWDDYDSVLSFLINFVEQKSLFNKILVVLLTQHNEYKLIFGNALYAFEYLISGKIDFSLLQIIGNSFVLLLLFSLYRVYSDQLPKNYLRIILFTPVPFFIFQLQYWQTLDWASAGLQNLTVIPFAILSIYFITKDHKVDFIASCIFLILSIFSSANALFLIPLGIVMLFQENKISRIFLWTTLSMILTALYFYKYSFGTGHGLSFGFYAKHFDIGYALAFLGSAASGSNYHIDIVFGIIIVIIFCFMIYNRYYRINPSAFYVILFVFITALILSMIRSRLGLAEAISSRYRIYSDILLVIVYLYLLSSTRKSRKFVFFLACVLAVLFCFYNDFVNYSNIVQRYNQLQEGVTTWMMTGSGLTYPSEKRATMLIAETSKLGIYSFPKPRHIVVKWPVELINNKPMALFNNQLAICRFHNYNYSNSLSIASVGVFQGNWGNTANGLMTVQLCAMSVCASGVRPLSELRDNSFFYIPLKNSLNVLPGEKLTLTIRHQGGNKPDALWVWPSKPGYPQELRGPQGPLPGKAIRIALKYQPQEHK